MIHEINTMSSYIYTFMIQYLFCIHNTYYVFSIFFFCYENGQNIQVKSTIW